MRLGTIDMGARPTLNPMYTAILIRKVDLPSLSLMNLIEEMKEDLYGMTYADCVLMRTSYRPVRAGGISVIGGC